MSTEIAVEKDLNRIEVGSRTEFISILFKNQIVSS
jgi:hypothetical protein